MRVVDVETYLTEHGASRQDIGDSALHKLPGVTESGRRALLKRQGELDGALLARRDVLRLAYGLAVEFGELRPPTRRERLEATAAGHPDRADVQAARRLLSRWSASFDFGEDGDGAWRPEK